MFIGENFVVGLCGKPDMFNLDELKNYVTNVSSKPAKCNVRDKVSFKFKEKGKKPVNVSGVCMFTITGADLPVDRIGEMLDGHGLVEMD